MKVAYLSAEVAPYAKTGGLGDVAGGQGVLGLQHALHKSGARTTVTSLWKVDEAATRALMQKFYTNLWDKKLPKVEALRRAQLHLLNNARLPDGQRLTRGAPRKVLAVDPNLPKRDSQRTDPIFWAAWVLSGDFR